MMIIQLFSFKGYCQFTGIGTSSPRSRLHVVGTSWFQGDNTPLSSAAGAGIGIGYSAGAVGYIYAFDYSTFQPKNLWINHTGASVLIGSTSSSPAARLDVTGNGFRAIYGSTTAGEAFYGYSTGGHGIWGRSSSNLGVYALSDAPASAGLIGEGKYIGVQGSATGTDANRQSVRGELPANTGGYAGIFVNGTTGVFGTLTKTAGAFLIDHPLEPSTKFLYHSFVESPDMKNIYDGVITTGADGLATVTMPGWFEALNMDFRYQLTVMGQFAQAIILNEMAANKFEIKTDKPNVKVSWQVTGTRHDPYAVDNPIPVEKLKASNEVGKFIYPQGYGKSSAYLLDILKPSNLTNTAIAAPTNTNE